MWDQSGGWAGKLKEKGLCGKPTDKGILAISWERGAMKTSGQELAALLWWIQRTNVRTVGQEGLTVNCVPVLQHEETHKANWNWDGGQFESDTQKKWRHWEHGRSKGGKKVGTPKGRASQELETGPRGRAQQTLLTFTGSMNTLASDMSPPN